MSNVETVSALGRRLNASIPQALVRDQVASRLKKIGRTAKLSGFRPGKVPAKVLEQYYGAQARQEALGDALQQSFAAAVQGSDLRIAGNPEFEIKTADLSADEIEYSATFEVYPEVVLKDLAAVDVERAAYALSQDDVDGTITTLRKQRATYHAADRAAEDGDKVRVDFEGTLDGVAFQGGSGKDVDFLLGGGNMLADFEAAIRGMKAGESKSFDMTFPADYHGKDVAGKQVTFALTLQAVEAPQLPELDAAFAEAIGISDGDVSKLEAEVRSNLEREVSRRLNTRNKEAAMDALLAAADFELPKALVEWESHNLMQQTHREMEARGMNMKGVSMPPDLFAERAARRVKLGLVLADLVQKQGLAAKPEQVKSLAEDFSQNYDHPEEVVKWYYAEPGRLQELENLALEDNVVDWVMQQAKVSDKAVTFAELMGQ